MSKSPVSLNHHGRVGGDSHSIRQLVSPFENNRSGTVQSRAPGSSSLVRSNAPSVQNSLDSSCFEGRVSVILNSFPKPEVRYWRFTRSASLEERRG